MIASDYLRCATSDVEYKQRLAQVEADVANFLFSTGRFCDWPTGKILLLSRELVELLQGLGYKGKGA